MEHQLQAGVAKTAPAADKPAQLAQVIDSVDCVTSRLSRLIARLNDTDNPDCAPGPPMPGNMSSVLNEGHAILADKLSMQNSHLDDIESILFG
jgi:hypothetical protein